MVHAFPEDELKPISCEPQTRNRENPADIGLNDVLGNYSLTLIDSLSTLAILASGQDSSDDHDPLRDFKDGVKALVQLYGAGDQERPCGSRACGFDLDSKVQVFETNIRGVGGLLSAHLFAVGELPIRGYAPKWETQKDGGEGIAWGDFRYDGQLLRLAQDLATRLLPAFDTATGLPYPRVNLRYGIPFYRDADDGFCRLDGSSTNPREITETCSAGAGSLILEFSTLSRLTGNLTFENLAKKAFWAVWDRRSSIGLVGNGIDAESGQWTLPALAGIGAGIDSFFEYAVKSFVLLSGLPYDSDEPSAHQPEAFLETWQKAHAGVKHHILRSARVEKYPFYGQTDLFSGAPRYSWVDNLSAYYPGLLTLAGEVEEAIESHLLFSALWTRYGALPERWHVYNAFIDPNFKHWAGRPEFIESTFHLYQATKDPFYLHVGEMALRDIRRRCWTQCGWADLGDVISGEKRDRMESFFLGETAKYLYLLFEQDHPLNKLDAPVVFTTEGHPLLIPVSVRRAHAKNERKTIRVHERTLRALVSTCPAPARTLPLAGSNIVSRGDFFHPAALVQLHQVPVQAARSSPLIESTRDETGISIADVRSPTNYTYYPWTLPQSLVPPEGYSSAIREPLLSTLTFPVLTPVASDGEKGAATVQTMQKILEGVVVSSLSNMRLSMVQEPTSLLLPDDRGVLVERDVGQQYRIHGIANWALGRDEKVVLTRDAVEGVSPGDPNFRRVKDLEMIDIVLDYSFPTSVKEAHFDSIPSEPISDTTMATNNTVSDLLGNFEALFARLIPSDSHPFGSPSSTPTPPLTRTMIPAILPTGVGAAPLPPAVDASDPFAFSVGNLPFSSVYYLDDTLCAPHRLPAAVPRSHQILVVKRGDCSFNDKLTNIPSFAPATEALQVVIVISTPDARSVAEEGDDDGGAGPSVGADGDGGEMSGLGGDKMIRPLLEERQRTAAGFERRHGIAMAMLEGRDEVVDALKAAAGVVGRFDGDGILQEERNGGGPGSGVGIKRRYWFESMGIPIGNLIAL